MDKYIPFLALLLLLGVGPVLAQNADTVDGFHAYGTPHANALLALDGSARFPGDAIANNSIPGSRLVPGAVTAGRLGNNSVTTEKISDGQVMAADLAAGAVTSSKIANNSVSYVKITDGTVRGEDMYVPLSMTGSRDGGIISATNTKTYFFGKYKPIGVYGYASGSGYVRGVYGRTDSSSGIGTYGYASSTTGTAVGAYGYSRAENGKGVMGYCSAESGANYGVYGEVRSGEPDCYAVYGKNYYGQYGALGTGSYGVYGKNQNGNYGYIGHSDRGAYGYHADTGNYGTLGSGSYGARGYNAEHGNHGYLGGDTYGAGAWSYAPDGVGVYGYVNSGSARKAIYGNSSLGHAGYFSGDVEVTGDFDVGGSKNFKIDHPLDPENMYLKHSCVESSERMNVYSGNVVLDNRGRASVYVPDWFEALNGDYRYNLTPIGSPGPNLYIAQEIAGGCFVIAGGVPGTKVSWVVIANRQDPYAVANPFEVEVEKPEIERGYYLHPEVYGQPLTMRVDLATNPEAMADVLSEE